MGEKQNAHTLWQGGDHEEDIDVGEKIILKWLGWDGTDWVHMDDDKDHWRALLSMIMSLQIPQSFGKFSEQPSDS
jgi:hypothetical protein